MIRSTSGCFRIKWSREPFGTNGETRNKFPTASRTPRHGRMCGWWSFCHVSPSRRALCKYYSGPKPYLAEMSAYSTLILRILPTGTESKAFQRDFANGWVTELEHVPKSSRTNAFGLPDVADCNSRDIWCRSTWTGTSKPRWKRCHHRRQRV